MVRGVETNTALAERHNRDGRLQSLVHALDGLGQTRIGFFVDGHAEPFTHFLQVGLEQVHMPVAVEISKLGVDGGFDALLTAQRRYRFDDRWSQRAFVVVFENDNVDAFIVDDVLAPGNQFSRPRLFQLARLLFIHPQELLSIADDARFDGGGTTRHFDQSGRSDALGLKQPLDFLSGSIVANRRSHLHLRTERNQILRNVGCSTQTPVPLVNVDDGHRGLRRNPVDLADEVGVEHHVADDKHRYPVGILKCVERFHLTKVANGLY